MRRKRSGLAGDFMGLMAGLPWWAGLAAAVGFYFLFNRLASAPAASEFQLGQSGGFIRATLIAAVAFYAQYFIPFLCAVAALASFLRRRKRTQLANNVVASEAAHPLDHISWREFEMLVGEAFRLQGYTVDETGGHGADGGVDLVLQKAGATFLVQCKQWKASTVPVTVVRELYGVMVHHQARGAFVVSSGRFTADAQAFAKGKCIELIDGAELVDRVRRAKGAPVPASSAELPTANQATPTCPNCSAPMVRRTARKGAQVGAQFWGCSRFPACRGVR